MSLEQNNKQKERVGILRVFCLLPIATLLFMCTMTVSGCSTWRKTPPGVDSKTVGSELLQNRLNDQISVLDRRCEDLETRVSQIAQEGEELEARVSQAVQRMEELKADITKPASSHESNPDKSQSVAEGIHGVKIQTTAGKHPTSPPAKEPKSLYQEAYQNYEKGDYTGAIVRFREFLDVYPSDDLADNALYWIGESFYAQRDYEEAITNFMKVVEQYPEGNKVPDALLKIGFSYSNLNQDPKAREYLMRLMDTYPFSDVTKKAVARLENQSQPVSSPP